MFNEPFGLQQATFDKIKDMTRRLVPKRILAKVDDYRREYYKQTLDRISVEDAIMNMVGPEKMFKAPYEVGEVVAIAQRYSQLEKEIERLGLPLDLKDWVRKHKGYNNKMYVRAEDMPHHIKITGFKVEYQQDISDEDCLREGIRHEHWGGRDHYTVGDYLLWDRTMRQRGFDNPRKAYEVLIRNMSGDKAWYSNPLVFAYSYVLVD